MPAGYHEARPVPCLDGIPKRLKLLDQHPGFGLAADLGVEADSEEPVPVGDLLQDVEPLESLNASVDQHVLDDEEPLVLGAALL